MSLFADEAKGPSFYESFTDLIFGTLVLFIVLVMAMALKLREAESNAVDAAAKTTAKVLERVSKSRFTGAPDQTFLHVCHLPINGVTHMVFVPVPIAQGLDLVRKESNNPILELCRLALEGTLQAVPAKQVVAMAKGLTEPVVNWDHAVLIHPTAGAVLYVGTNLARSQPGRWDPKSLCAALGGIGFDYYRGDRGSDPRVVTLLQEYRAYQSTAGRGWHETTGELEKRLADTKTEPPRIRLTCFDRGSIGIGDARFAPVVVGQLLEAVKPGRGFYLVHVGADGVPTAFPTWFRAEILDPLGYDRRVLREEALRLALRGNNG